MEPPAEKKCGRCGIVKEAADFGIVKEAADFGISRSRCDGLQSHCRDCKRVFQNDWYQKNKARHVENVVRQRKERVTRLRTRLRAYLLEHPCIECGEAEPLMLDFDHVRGTKRMNVCEMVGACLSWETILDEIAKCEVRCVKCHRRRTATQLGWYAE